MDLEKAILVGFGVKEVKEVKELCERSFGEKRLVVMFFAFSSYFFLFLPYLYIEFIFYIYIRTTTTLGFV